MCGAPAAHRCQAMAEVHQRCTQGRFPISYRVEHALLIAGFAILVVLNLIRQFVTGWCWERLIRASVGADRGSVTLPRDPSPGSSYRSSSLLNHKARLLTGSPAGARSS